MALLEAFARPFDAAAATAAHAALLDDRLALRRTRDLLDEVINREFRGRVALVSSFGADSVVLLHLVASVAKDTPVIFIDTGKLFGTTQWYKDEIVSRLGLTDVQVARPDPAVLTTQDSDAGLWMRDPDACCAIRKVAPLAQALAGFDAWMSGRKRYQGGSRAELPVFEADGRRVKINPLAGWSRADLDGYRRLHGLPEHPLVADGYRSIGCEPCTERADGSDERSGRWSGTGKTECGIHWSLAAYDPGAVGL
jgi:phosphoadenosine phosphosulfate reductase